MLDSVIALRVNKNDAFDCPRNSSRYRAVSSRDVTADASRPIGARALGRAARSITSLAKVKSSSSRCTVATMRVVQVTATV